MHPSRRLRAPKPSEPKKNPPPTSGRSTARTKSERASGIGETQEDQQTSDRDADGRRLWEAAAKKKAAAEAEAEIDRKAKDPTGMSGNELDLTG